MEALDQEKTNALTNSINHQTNHKYSTIDKINLYDKEPYKSKYQLLIKKRGDAGIKHFNNAKAFIEYSNPMVDVYDYINDHNPNRNRKILISFDDMIADMNTNINFQDIVKTVYQMQETEYLLSSSQNLIFLFQKQQIKLYALPNNENS